MSGKILGGIMIVMETNDLELYLSKLKNDIRTLFFNVTCTKYIGDLELDIINDCNNNLYTLRICLNTPDVAPIVLGFQGNENQFMKYLEKEFRKRKLQEITYTKATLINGGNILHVPIIEI